MVTFDMGLLDFLKENENTRKIFGERELKIIEKQLTGINLTQSEKNRLSRDIRKKFEFIKEASWLNCEFELKKGELNKKLVEEAKEVILKNPLSARIKSILLFGSMIDNSMTYKSDIDIAVVFDKIDLKEATKFRIDISGQLSKKADIQVFNVLPEKMKKSIMEKHRVIYENKR